MTPIVWKLLKNGHHRSFGVGLALGLVTGLERGLRDVEFLAGRRLLRRIGSRHLRLDLRNHAFAINWVRAGLRERWRGQDDDKCDSKKNPFHRLPPNRWERA